MLYAALLQFYTKFDVETTWLRQNQEEKLLSCPVVSHVKGNTGCLTNNRPI